MNNGFDSFQYSDAYYDPAFYMKKSVQKRSLRRLGVYTATAILLSILLQNVTVASLELFGLFDRYFSDAYFSSAVDIIIAVFGMLVPFALMGRKMKNASGLHQPLMIDKPHRFSLMPAAVFAGMGFCMAGNIINSYISVFFSSMDVELTSPEIPMADGVSGVILTFFRVAITAGVVEELCFRGFVMGNLRFYGDGFAIATASVVFAILHGNMVQAPFALMAGFALGYLSVKTGTIWTGIIIHVLNNSVSLIIYYLRDYMTDEELTALYVLILYGLILLGAVSFAYFSVRTRKRPLFKGDSLLSTGEKIKAYFINLPMLIVIAYMLYITAEYVKKGS